MVWNEESLHFRNMILNELNPAKNKLKDKYRGTKGFVGIGDGIDKTDSFCIVVYISDLTAPIFDDLKDLGMVFDGINVEVKEIGEIRPAAMHAVELINKFDELWNHEE